MLSARYRTRYQMPAHEDRYMPLLYCIWKRVSFIREEGRSLRKEMFLPFRTKEIQNIDTFEKKNHLYLITLLAEKTKTKK